MEVDFVTGDVLDEETLKIDDNNINDDSGFEAERCGICMEIVIDRGVLDCCQHWFCFGCIDNWATIINLCPLCQNEFQLITCVPVYDTIGSNKVDEDSMSRDDDWSVEGKNNTLSFPSYYIDENAVICLDGDGCRIRSGSTTVEEDSDLDTSIACDSCEIWYHAFCVGFDTEGTSEDTWICPRCAVDKVVQKSDVTSTQQPKNKCPESSSSSCLAKDALSGKMSISVADAGETAVVVSMVGGSEWIKGQSEDSEPSLEVDRDVKIEVVSPDNRDVKVEAVSPDDNNLKTETAPGQKMDFQPILGSQGLELSLSYDTSFSPPSDSLVLNGLKASSIDTAMNEPSSSVLNGLKASSIDTAMNEPSSSVLNGLKASSIDTAMNEPSSSVLNGLKASSIDTAMNEPSSSDGVRSSLTKLLDHSCAKNLPSECATNIDLHLGLSVGCSLSANQKKSSGTEDDITRDAQLQGSLEEFLSRDEKILFDAYEDTVKITGIKRKSDDVLEADDQQASATNEAIAKKSRAEGKFQKTTSQGQPEMLLSDDSQNYATEAEALFDVKLKKCPERDVVTSDIMSIVQETSHGASKGVVCRSPTEQSSRERENAAGLRVKKIMRRVAEDDSSTEVQKLRKEIREAVHNKSKADIGENIFDPKLLAAFRHAVAESTTEIVDKLPPSSLKAKRSMLQKGKTRENLTKKIYGNSNGRRKRAWDRDCEVEFWKHRCMRTTKPEKVATLKSVLNVLKGNLEGSDMQQTYEYRTTDPILSRLYVADTSVFPRKDDIKPLSALSSISSPIKILAQPISIEKGEKSSLEGHTPKSSDSNRVASILGFSTLHDKVVKDKVPSLKGKASSPTAHPARGPEGGIMAPSGGSNLKLHKEASPQFEDKKVDKRKWALEILARKKAVAGNDAKHEKQEDNAMLKGNYPLLAQLPTDMRPVLAPSRHNKIPISVRQTQLFRLTEHFLKKVNLPEIRRTAETELAVADAINIEKEVADKSKSKLVYLNLCSQELFHRSDSSKSVRSMESDPSPQTVAPIDGSEQVSYEIPTDPTVTEALRNAGLLSDSPPGSPYHKMDPPNETENLPMEIKEEGPEEEDHDNILEMDSLPEVDIYGDFDYTLEDEDYIGVTTMEISKLAPEDGESKMKVVFSTLKSENLSHAEGCEEHGRLENVEPKDSTSLPDTHVDGGIASSTLEGTTDKPHVPSESLPDQGDEEPSLAECEELYGPDKELLINKFPEEESTKPYGLVESKAPVGNEVPGKNENFVSGLSDNTILGSAGESSCHGEITSVQVNEKVPRKDNFNTEKQSDVSEPVSKKVEAYVKEHIRPLCKSGVITTEQYRWAVAKTTDKVMKYHSNAKNANFLIKEGEKVKKLAEQYVETAQWKEKD